jgi:predicted lysophospholipase L1 biosynthesis ABC-type transport system permease subunit
MASRWIKTLALKKISAGMAILTLIGTMIQHLTGNILYEVLLGQLTSSVPAAAYPAAWTAVFFIYPVERSFLIVSAVLVGTPLVRIINSNPILQAVRKQTSEAD